MTKDYDIGFGVFSKPLEQVRKLHAGEMAVHVSGTVCVRACVRACVHALL